MSADGLDELIADLTTAGVRAGIRAVKAAEDAGRKVRDEARELAPRVGLPHYAETITYEVDVESGSVEIGPETGGQGSLGHLLENGVPSNGTPPHPHVLPAFDRAVPGFIAAIADIGGDIL